MMKSCMNYLNNVLAGICGNTEPAETSEYTLVRNKDGSGDVTCVNCGCIHRIDGDKKQMLNNKQIHCKVCGALLTRWKKDVVA